VLILQGKQDDEVSGANSAAIDKILSDSGNKSHFLRYYSYLDRYFGTRVNDGTHKIHYNIDEEVTKDVINWLTNKAFAQPDNASAAAQAESSAQNVAG
jgi:hypothetical protein